MGEMMMMIIFLLFETGMHTCGCVPFRKIYYVFKYPISIPYHLLVFQHIKRNEDIPFTLRRHVYIAGTHTIHYPLWENDKCFCLPFHNQPVLCSNIVGICDMCTPKLYRIRYAMSWCFSLLIIHMQRLPTACCFIVECSTATPLRWR